MTWNWELSDWPDFTWDHEHLAQAEQDFLMRSGVLIGTIKHLKDEDREQLTIESMSSEALKTSEIEGEILDRESVQSSIRKQLGVTTDNRRMPPAEQGIAEMMVSLYRSFHEPLTDDSLFAWHRMIFKGRRGIEDIGRYRTHDEPMQIVSGRKVTHTPEIHFEAPPSKQVPDEMKGFLDWFNRTASGGTDPLPAITRAGIAHLYFESIHPFEDGNGRIGRAISEKALAQSVNQPIFTALATTMLKKRKAYYRALEGNSTTNEVTDWLVWFAETAIEAQGKTITLIEFLLEKTRLFDRLRGQLNGRQEKALLRMFREGPDGFQGGLSAGNYRSITQASPATATRDLADLVDKGALIRTGQHRHARYQVNIKSNKESEDSGQVS